MHGSSWHKGAIFGTATCQSIDEWLADWNLRCSTQRRSWLAGGCALDRYGWRHHGLPAPARHRLRWGMVPVCRLHILAWARPLYREGNAMSGGLMRGHHSHLCNPVVRRICHFHQATTQRIVVQGFKW